MVGIILYQTVFQKLKREIVDLLSKKEIKRQRQLFFCFEKNEISEGPI